MTTYYIDPSASTNGDGSLASPFNTWASVTWAPNNIYLQKTNTTYKGQVDIAANGPITVGSYGSFGRAVIDANGASYALFNRYRSNITIQDLDFTGASIDGCHIEAYGVNLSNNYIYRCNSYKNTRNGFYLDSVTLTCALDNVLFDNCNAYGNGRHGFDTLGIVTNVTYQNCDAYLNGWAEPGHGFSLHPFASTTTTGWTLVSGTIYSRTLAASETVQKVIDRTNDVTLTQNIATPTTPSTNEWGQSGTTLYINIGVDPTNKTITWKRAAHGPFNYYYCRAWENISNPLTAGEGHGFASDDTTGPTNYYYCRSWKNKGAGFQCQWTDNIYYLSCLSYQNSLSNFRTTGNTNTITGINCTSVGSLQHGYFYDTPLTGVNLYNCIAYKNGVGSSGIYGIVGTGVNTSNCNVFGNPLSTSGTSNTTLTTTDPQLNSFFLPNSSTVTGVSFPLIKDLYSHTFSTPPTVGVYQYILPRNALTQVRTFR